MNHPDENVLIRLSGLPKGTSIPPELAWAHQHLQGCGRCKLAFESARDIDLPPQVNLRNRYQRFVEVNETPAGIFALALTAVVSLFVSVIPTGKERPLPHDRSRYR